MAKTQSTNLADGLSSSFDIGTRKRQAIAIGDLLDSGETNCLELPAHDSPDRGHPVKIGGRATDVGYTQVVAGDRADAWFTLNGQLMCQAAFDASYVVDNGVRYPIQYTWTSFTHANNAVGMAGAVAGNRYKVLAVNVVPVTITTEGSAILSDGVSLSFYIGRVANIGHNLYRSGNGIILWQTGVGNPMNGLYNASAGLGWSVTYYVAP